MKNESNIDTINVCRYNISTRQFEWDPEKNKINLAKHGVSFEEASTVFLDINAIYIFDGNHSDAEERFVALGISNESRMLLVCHCYRDNDQITRIITARKAEKDEEQIYYKKYFDPEGNNE